MVEARNGGGQRGGDRGRNGDRREDDPGERTTRLALSAWNLARTRTRLPDSARGQVMTLRTQQRLVHAFEQGRAVPAADSSMLRVQDDGRGSVLLVHGVSTRPADLHGLADALFDSGFTVYVMRLPDYGLQGTTISEVSWEAALEQVRQRFRLLARGGGRVHAVGLGFGATLAVHLASLESVSSLVLLAPAIVARESFFQRLLVRVRLHRLAIVHRWLGWNADLMEGMDRAKGKIGGLKIPVYAAQCDDDDRACPTSLRLLQRKAHHSASRFQVFPTGGHAILATHGEAGLFDEIARFCAGP